MYTCTVEDKGVTATLDRIADRIAFPAWAYAIAADVIADSTERRFANGGDPPGSWPDISAQTRKRRKGDKSAPPLTDEGLLRAAATATQPGVQYSLFAIQPDGLTMGTNAPGARALQYGYVEGGRMGPGHGTPARPFMLITDADQAEMAIRYQGVLRSTIEGR